MSNPKGVTIKLTDKQRHQIRTATGQDHAEIRIERQAIGTDAATTSRQMAGIAAGKRVFGGRTAGKRIFGGRTAGKRVFGGKTGAKTLLGNKVGAKSLLGNKVGAKRIK